MNNIGKGYRSETWEVHGICISCHFEMEVLINDSNEPITKCHISPLDGTINKEM